MDQAYSVLGNVYSVNQPSTGYALPGTLKMGAMSSDQIDKVARDFESMFIGQMLEPMFGDSEGADAFGSTESNDVYKGLLMDEYGKQITRSGGIGIADYVKKELLRLQEHGS